MALQDQAKEFVRRAPLLGLGATATAPQTHKEKRIIRPGESREAKKDLVVYDEKGHIKHTRTADDKLVERIVKGPKVGKQMRIIKGRDAGIRCKVCVIHDQVRIACAFTAQPRELEVLGPKDLCGGVDLAEGSLWTGETYRLQLEPLIMPDEHPLFCLSSSSDCFPQASAIQSFCRLRQGLIHDTGEMRRWRAGLRQQQSGCTQVRRW